MPRTRRTNPSSFRDPRPRETVKLAPQPAQERFLSSPADIVIGGGAAGGGKSWSLLFEALRHCRRPGFTGLIFRRTYPEITAPGGLWQESGKAYHLLGGVANQSTLTWYFPDEAGVARGGGVVKFGSLQHEQDVQDYRGAQVCYLAFDQLETFTEYQFFYMLTRNRPSLPCTIRPYVRATANPEPGWLAEFLGWWIGRDGYPDPVRIGKIRWLYRENDQNHWADSWQELHEQYPTRVKPEMGKVDLVTGRTYLPPPPTEVGSTTVATGNTDYDDERIEPKSITFIPFKLQDNPHLYRSNPSYRANLEAAPHIEKMRLLHGNWYVSSAKGEWPSDYFETVRFQEYPNAHWIVSVLACDPSKGRSDRFGDFAAWTWLRVDSLGIGEDGRHLPGTLWFDAWLDKWTSTELLEEGLRIARICGLPPMVFEVNGFQELLAGDFARLCVQRGVFPRVWGIVNVSPKPVRIRRWGPFLAQRRIKIRSSPGGDMLTNQLRTFGPNDPTLHDDGPDSGEMAIRIAEYLLYGSAALEDPHNPPVPLAIAGLDGMYSENQLRNGGANGAGSNWMYGNNVPNELQQRRIGHQ